VHEAGSRKLDAISNRARYFALCQFLSRLGYVSNAIRTALARAPCVMM
jgi:hypothetical protein